MTKSFTQRLPEWGPYTKWYAGTSHVPDESSGMRFDLSVFPAFYRRKLELPNVTWETNYHPWRADPGLRQWTYRFQLEWRDRVYADITYQSVAARGQAIRVELVNDTDAPQALALHFLAACHYPTTRPYAIEPLVRDVLKTPPGARWVAAIDYDRLVYARPRPTDNLMPDGLRRGEQRESGTLAGSFIAAFGADAGDTVSWGARGEDARLAAVRCRSHAGAAFDLNGRHAVVPPSPQWQWVYVPLTPGPLRLTSSGAGEFDIDGIVLLDGERPVDLPVEPGRLHYRPQIDQDPPRLCLRYPDLPDAYHLQLPDGLEPHVREVNSDEPDRLLRQKVHNHGLRLLREPGALRWWQNVLLQPIDLAAGERRTLTALVGAGALPADDARALTAPAGDDARPYAFGQQLMAATLATNVVYPVYCKRQYIKHYAPGRWWDSLYTWDSGFIGLGLAELCYDRAINCLDAYLTDPDDDECAFIHHGSPVPVQAYLWKDLFDRRPDPQFLAERYASLRRYYLFLTGRLGSSTTAVLNSGLLKTWDYFYNSGGWDDYPPQHHLLQHQAGYAHIAPAITTAHAIRFARILGYAADRLGHLDDAAGYQHDIERFTAALHDHAWDPGAGYFSYVRHDEAGRPVGVFADPGSGDNFNRGLDGVSPLVAGACNPEQTRLLLHKLTSDRHLWTDVGLTAVDRAAPYYRHDGYWNGTVWMPHQWFIWKAMLDLGQIDFAWRIAHTALDVWERECRESYRCFEHFEIATGRGAGWHEFGGLSAPVLNWHAAYFQPGRITVGFDTWVEGLEVSADGRRLAATLRVTRDGPAGVLVTLDGSNPTVRIDDTPAQVRPQVGGCVAVLLPAAGTFRLTAAAAP